MSPFASLFRASSAAAAIIVLAAVRVAQLPAPAQATMPPVASPSPVSTPAPQSTPAPAASPASTITSVTLTSTGATYSGACPTTIQFTGTVVGTAGTTFVYKFPYRLNGAPPSSSAGVGFLSTLPSSGSVVLGFLLRVAHTTHRFSSIQLAAQVRGVHQPLMVSSPLGYSVTCK